MCEYSGGFWGVHEPPSEFKYWNSGLGADGGWGLRDWGLREGVWLNKLSDYRFLEYQPRVCDLADFEKNQHLEGSDLYLITYSSVGPQWVSCGCTPFLLAFSWVYLWPVTLHCVLVGTQLQTPARRAISVWSFLSHRGWTIPGGPCGWSAEAVGGGGSTPPLPSTQVCRGACSARLIGCPLLSSSLTLTLLLSDLDSPAQPLALMRNFGHGSGTSEQASC